MIIEHSLFEITYSIRIIHHVFLDCWSINPSNKIFQISENNHVVIWLVIILDNNKHIHTLINVLVYLVTKNAGSLTISGPTLTCPCSISWVAIFMFSLILLRTITTGNLLLQKELAVTFWHSERSHFVGMIPSMYNFSNNAALCSILNGLSASNSFIFLPSSRISRDSLLYLQWSINNSHELLCA